jgi:hypothetical protein
MGLGRSASALGRGKTSSRGRSRTSCAAESPPATAVSPKDSYAETRPVEWVSARRSGVGVEPTQRGAATPHRF